MLVVWILLVNSVVPFVLFYLWFIAIWFWIGGLFVCCVDTCLLLWFTCVCLWFDCGCCFLLFGGWCLLTWLLLVLNWFALSGLAVIGFVCGCLHYYTLVGWWLCWVLFLAVGCFSFVWALRCWFVCWFRFVNVLGNCVCLCLINSVVYRVVHIVVLFYLFWWWFVIDFVCVCFTDLDLWMYTLLDVARVIVVFACFVDCCVICWLCWFVCLVWVSELLF